MFISLAKRHVQSSDCLKTFNLTQLLFLADRAIVYCGKIWHSWLIVAGWLHQQWRNMWAAWCSG